MVVVIIRSPVTLFRRDCYQSKDYYRSDIIYFEHYRQLQLPHLAYYSIHFRYLCYGPAHHLNLVTDLYLHYQHLSYHPHTHQQPITMPIKE